jgi:glutamate-1-semialdehyde aminotransferase
MDIGDKHNLRRINSFYNSNEYRKIIHQLIPGGAHTYSKGDDQFPELSPAAISHGKGAYVWDIDDNVYLDCSMGLTSVSLGHAYEPVLSSVRKELEKGVNFQRPSLLEKATAENFLSLVPQHDMIKFSKNGSIVTTAAVKLARAYTGRKLIAFPGDHPFYSYDDWFIGTTSCNKGVPNEFSDLSVTFKACNLDSLKQLFEQYPDQIACVISEPVKSPCGNGCDCKHSPDVFLKKAIDLAHEHGALFIIDEMVSGFKTDFPGAISKYDLKPDLATWGKGIANGFSFCALTGIKQVMELGGITKIGEEKVFLISTTHGGETHTMAAVNATIDIFRQHNVIAHNQSIGEALIKGCQSAILNQGALKLVDIIPCNWLVTFNFKDEQGHVSTSMRTLAMQEMIKRGVLFQGAFSPCYSHSIEDVAYFVEAFTETLQVLKNAVDQGVDSLLVGKPAKPVFRKVL